MTGKTTRRESGFALRFIFASLAVFGLAGGLAYALIHFGNTATARSQILPPAFWLTSALLATGSVALYSASNYVRIEKQRPFRRCLLVALAAGTLFVGFQSYGLACLLSRQNPADVATGVNAFIFVFATLHGLHFALALWFLVFVTLRAFADAYDHEYSWGVTVCGWFWHFLGAVWLCILAVFLITA